MLKERHGYLFGFLAALFGSGMGLFAKLADQMPISTIVFARFALSVPFIIWMFTHQRQHLPTKNAFPLHLLRSLMSLSALYAYFYSVRRLFLVDAVTFFNTAPLFLPLLAFFFFRMIVSKNRFLGIFIGFLGVVVLLRPFGHSMQLMASMIALLGAFCSAVALMTVRKLSKTEPTKSILLSYFLIGTILSFFPLIGSWVSVSDPLQWIYTILGGVCALVFQYMLTKAYTHAPATKVSTMNYLGVVFGGIYGWAIFGEIPTLWALAGVGLIILGALIAIFDRGASRKR